MPKCSLSLVNICSPFWFESVLDKTLGLGCFCSMVVTTLVWLEYILDIEISEKFRNNSFRAGPLSVEYYSQASWDVLPFQLVSCKRWSIWRWESFFPSVCRHLLRVVCAKSSSRSSQSSLPCSFLPFRKSPCRASHERSYYPLLIGCVMK